MKPPVLGFTCSPGEACETWAWAYTLLLMAPMLVLFMLIAVPTFLIRKRRGHPVPWRQILVVLLVLLWPIGVLYLVWKGFHALRRSGSAAP